MGIRSLSTASISSGVKRSKAWDQNTVYVPPAFESISTVTVGSGGVSSISFTSIPSTYKHLQLRYSALWSDGTSEVPISFNSDTTDTNYSRGQVYADGGSSNGFSVVTSNTRPIMYTRNTSSLIPSISVVDIFDYKETTKNKTLRFLNSQDYNGSGMVAMGSMQWMNSANAITSITLAPAAGNIRQYSHFALYGIKE